jgi:hypothetical protein
MEKVSYRPLLWRLSRIFAAGILFLSCGFEPAWKSQDTTVSFRLGPAARAVALGGGYLYIRPLGGPLGIGPKPYLGPIELSAGDTFTTTEIAPGSYDGFALVYSPYIIDDMNYGNGRSVQTVFTAPMPTSCKSSNCGNERSIHRRNRESCRVVREYGSGNRGREEVTEVKATLLPMTNLVYDLMNNTLGTFGVSNGQYYRFRYFVRVENIRSEFTNDARAVYFSVSAIDVGATVSPSSGQLYQTTGKPWTTIIREQDPATVTYNDSFINYNHTPVTPDILFLYIDVYANHWYISVTVENLLW